MDFELLSKYSETNFECNWEQEFPDLKYKILQISIDLYQSTWYFNLYYTYKTVQNNNSLYVLLHHLIKVSKTLLV